jgi:hypothetical protein
MFRRININIKRHLSNSLFVVGILAMFSASALAQSAKTTGHHGAHAHSKSLMVSGDTIILTMN